MDVEGRIKDQLVAVLSDVKTVESVKLLWYYMPEEVQDKIITEMTRLFFEDMPTISLFTTAAATLKQEGRDK